MLKVILISFGIIITALAITPYLFSFNKPPVPKSVMIQDKSLELYFMNSCPFCHKVLNFVQQNNLPVAINYIDDDNEKRDKLLSIGGKSQVPCLVMNNEEALYESNDIINWLRANAEPPPID